jgi:hypothetical protein
MTPAPSITAGPPVTTSRAHRMLTREACVLLGCGHDALRALGVSRGVSADARGTWPSDQITAWSTDPTVAEWLHRHHRVGPTRARDLLQVSERDWRWLLQREVILPADLIRNPNARRAGLMAVFEIGDLEDLGAGTPEQLVPGTGISWAQVRAVPAGRTSALAVAPTHKRPPTIGTRLRNWQRAHGRDWAGLIVDWDRSARRWTVDLPVGLPEGYLMLLRDELAQHHPVLATGVQIGTPYRACIRRARALIEPGAAVVIDTETTDFDGYLVEIAVVDAATGEVLLASLVRPGEPSSAEALSVHGISDAEAAAAPTLTQIAPQLLAAIGERTILAYNADFDRSVLARHADRDGVNLPRLLDPDRWECVMDLRTRWLDLEHRLALEGGHRAVSDCQAARTVLHAIAADPGTRIR